MNTHEIEHLINTESPTLEGRGEQTPALECTVFLIGIGPVRGALARCDGRGGYKMLTKAQDTDGKDQLIEMFFDNTAITSIAIERRVSVAPSIIIKPS